MDTGTFVVSVEGVGTFECRRRTMRVQVSIASEYNRLVDGAETVGAGLDGLASFMSYLRCMIVSAPDGWDAYALDPDDPETMKTLRTVFDAIQDAEGRFRTGATPQPEDKGKGAL